MRLCPVLYVDDDSLILFCLGEDFEIEKIKWDKRALWTMSFKDVKSSIKVFQKAVFAYIDSLSAQIVQRNLLAAGQRMTDRNAAANRNALKHHAAAVIVLKEALVKHAGEHIDAFAQG